MNNIFSDLLDVCIVIYLDDILIYSNNMSEHHWHVKEVLKCLHKAGLYCKKTKQWTLIYFPFLFFIFSLIILHFSIFKTLGLGLEVIGHTVTSVISDGIVTTLITGLERRE